ncbi:hypothetical protein F5Y19DRAFT_303484 [Xylariaceae sp. FL1651]|nr:hypothetical protein F5Y19DRAFT_303484 [Xylariaceae sp. FL1651]
MRNLPLLLQFRLLVVLGVSYYSYIKKKSAIFIAKIIMLVYIHKIKGGCLIPLASSSYFVAFYNNSA